MHSNAEAVKMHDECKHMRLRCSVREDTQKCSAMHVHT